MKKKEIKLRLKEDFIFSAYNDKEEKMICHGAVKSLMAIGECENPPCSIKFEASSRKLKESARVEIICEHGFNNFTIKYLGIITCIVYRRMIEFLEVEKNCIRYVKVTALRKAAS